MEPCTAPKQSFIPSWPPSCSSEASASFSHSASSAVVSPVCDTQCESSARTYSSPLKEHDYIGLSEISSTASFTKAEQTPPHVYSINHDDGEPDLRLGLGPSAAKGACGDGTLHTLFEPKREVVKDAPTCSTSSVKRPDVKPACSAIVDSYAKSAKRPFSDTVGQGIADVWPVAGEDTKPGALLTTGQVRMAMHMPDVDTNPLSKQQQMVYRASPRAPSWHSELAHTTGSYGHLGNGKLLKNNPDHTTSSGNLVIRNLEPTTDEAPPAKEQVVGWPPVGPYRRSAIARRSNRPVQNGGAVQSAIYVKVNMDGIPIGRKVDLNAYSSYKELRAALEGMFHSPHVGENAHFLHTRDFVLTYEDKEGDWMLVGDVPWSMFVNTVKRLRIVRGSDSTCLGSSTSKNVS